VEVTRSMHAPDERHEFGFACVEYRRS